MEEPDAFTLLGREAVEFETRLGQIERATRDVHPDDLGELAIGEQPAEQFALAAAKIEYPGGARGLQHIEHGIEAAFVKADRALD